MKLECVTSDKLYKSMSNYEPKTKFWTKFGPKRAINVGLKYLFANPPAFGSLLWHVSLKRNLSRILPHSNILP